MDLISESYDLKFLFINLNSVSFLNSLFQKFFDITLIRIPIQTSNKKRTSTEFTFVNKESEKEKTVLKPIANSFLVNKLDDSQNETESYLKKEKCSQNDKCKIC